MQQLLMIATWRWELDIPGPCHRPGLRTLQGCKMLEDEFPLKIGLFSGPMLTYQRIYLDVISIHLPERMPMTSLMGWDVPFLCIILDIQQFIIIINHRDERRIMLIISLFIDIQIYIYICVCVYIHIYIYMCVYKYTLSLSLRACVVIY